MVKIQPSTAAVYNLYPTIQYTLYTRFIKVFIYPRWCRGTEVPLRHHLHACCHAVRISGCPLAPPKTWQHVGTHASFHGTILKRVSPYLYSNISGSRPLSVLSGAILVWVGPVFVQVTHCRSSQLEVEPEIVCLLGYFWLIIQPSLRANLSSKGIFTRGQPSSIDKSIVWMHETWCSSLFFRPLFRQGLLIRFPVTLGEV